MPVSPRPLLAAGIAAISATAIVAAPVLRAVPDELTSRQVRLTASQTVTPEFRALAVAAQQQLAAQNAATNAVDYAYSVLTYWTDYGVELADYALQFVPLGYLISSQINIIYPQVIRVTDSNALVNVVLGEVDYFFGWLIPPLPPRPFDLSAIAEVDGELLDDQTVEIGEEELDAEPTEGSTARPSISCWRRRTSRSPRGTRSCLSS